MEDGYRNPNADVDASKSDKPIWLMKCPSFVSMAWKSSSAPQPLGKVVFSVDPLQLHNPTANQFTLEMYDNEVLNMPWTYTLNMSTDIVPMCAFSETSKGKLAVEGNVKFKMNMEIPTPVMTADKDKCKAHPVKRSGMKRTKMDRGELEAKIFKLFEKQPKWSFKQVVQETDQPQNFVREVLREMCEYTKKGSDRGTHKLKPSYKESDADTTTKYYVAP